MTDTLVYNDYVTKEKKKLKNQLKKGEIDEIDYDIFYSNVFFTLANTKRVSGYH